MNALYKNRIYNVVDAAGDITLDGKGVEPFDVLFCDPELIVEPTDDQVANADNLAEWYGVGGEVAVKLRATLLGVVSIGEWWDWKASRQQ